MTNSLTYYQLLFLIIFILAFFPSAFRFVVLRLPLLSITALLSPERPVAEYNNNNNNSNNSPCCPPLPSHHHSSSHEDHANPEPPLPLAAAAAAAAAANQALDTNTMPSPSTSWYQKTIHLPPHSKGSYLITSEITSALNPELRSYKVGLLHLFVQHTSCALSLNENWDRDVREDMSDALDRIAPEEGKRGGGEEVRYRHSAEGEDDMPAHIKSSLIGSSVTIPISDGKLATGTWQGIWYLEFRARKHSRSIVATIQGQKKGDVEVGGE